MELKKGTKRKSDDEDAQITGSHKLHLYEHPKSPSDEMQQFRSHVDLGEREKDSISGTRVFVISCSPVKEETAYSYWKNIYKMICGRLADLTLSDLLNQCDKGRDTIFAS